MPIYMYILHLHVYTCMLYSNLYLSIGPIMLMHNYIHTCMYNMYIHVHILKEQRCNNNLRTYMYMYVVLQILEIGQMSIFLRANWI